MEAAMQIFCQFVDGGLDYVQSLPPDAKEESLHLEFKTRKSQGAKLGDDDKRTVAKIISGFANSEGGVAVWGVNAKVKDDESPDVVQSLEPIANLKKFVSDLKELQAELTSPTVKGILFEAIALGDTDKGFVAMYVPRNEGEPIMATGKGQRQYYYRDGRRTQTMLHYQVADMFGRRPQPKIELIWRSDVRMDYVSPGNASGQYLLFDLKNVGKAVAKNVAVRLYSSATFDAPKVGRFQGDPEIIRHLPEPWNRDSVIYNISETRVLHIGTAIESAHYRLSDSLRGSVDINFELFCEGFYQKGVLRIDEKEITEKYSNNID